MEEVEEVEGVPAEGMTVTIIYAEGTFVHMSEVRRRRSCSKVLTQTVHED